MIKKKKQNKEDKDKGWIHPLWTELMNYVGENGGHLRLNIRFKDGLPVEADDIRKKVRFDINYQTKTRKPGKTNE